jgi:hypothetical protein
MQQDQQKAQPGQPGASEKLDDTRTDPESETLAGKTSVQSGPDIEKAQSLDDSPEPDLTNQHGEHAERSPERDERGRL